MTDSGNASAQCSSFRSLGSKTGVLNANSPEYKSPERGTPHRGRCRGHFVPVNPRLFLEGHLVIASVRQRIIDDDQAVPKHVPLIEAFWEGKSERCSLRNGKAGRAIQICNGSTLFSRFPVSRWVAADSTCVISEDIMAISIIKAFIGLFVSCLALQCTGLTIAGKPNTIIKPYKRELLQDIVSLKLVPLSSR